jgi:ubiquinone biosynthesis protein
MAAILDTVRDLGRLREIAGVLARHGFDELLQRTGLSGLVPGKRSEDPEPKLSVRIRLVLEELGPTFIKLGQVLSTRADLLPADVVTELKQLQDNVPPLPFEEMRGAIESELGAPISSVFSQFEEQPLASASIGQVYRAQLSLDDGPVSVVMKVQRPNVSRVIDRDIDLLYSFAHTIERSIPESRAYRPSVLVAEFDRAIRAELDYAQEADHAERFAENFAQLTAVVRFPKVYRELSSKKVITLEYFDGLNVFDAVARGASAERIAKNAVQVVVKMIFEHGFFHADPHPGNILIMGTAEEPVLGLIDLGLVGRLSPRLRDRLIDLLIASASRDTRVIADVLYAIGRPTKKIDRGAFEADVGRLADKYLGRKLGDVAFAELLRDLSSAALTYGIEMPGELLMVGKAMMTVEGIARQIYPEIDLVREIRPYFAEIVGYRYSPERIASDLLHVAARFANAASEFPARADDILEDLRQGRMSAVVRQPNLARATDRLGRRIAHALFSSALALGGCVLWTAAHPSEGMALIGLAVAWFVVSPLLVGSDKERD